MIDLYFLDGLDICQKKRQGAEPCPIFKGGGECQVFLSLSPSALQRRKARRKADISVLMTLELIFIIFFLFPGT